MSIQDYHKETIAKVANALGDINNKVVYVGGSVVGLYVNDPAAPDVRPTDDVDITLEITSVGKLEALRQQLVAKGFGQSPEDNVICRFRYDGY
jgi:predicted nucleotidyltransferase